MEKARRRKSEPVAGPKGMHDILPQDQWLWERVLGAARKIANYYNFVRLDTPVVERRELFERTAGEATDIVEKQMFAVQTRARERLVLRPEWTAAAVRSFIEHGLGGSLGFPLKLYGDGFMFRHEQPQADRYRQFRQISFEILSTENDPIYDVQAIVALFRTLESLKLKNCSFVLNSIGCKTCRIPYRRELSSFYRARKTQLCTDCVRRLGMNPLRLLDCKHERCIEIRGEAPIMIDRLCAPCRKHFELVLEYLDELGIPYELNNYLVRGLDYYTKTVFEVVCDGVHSAVGGGGRYDYLVEALGGKSTPAVGVAAGVERIIEAMRFQNVTGNQKVKQKIFLVHMGEFSKKRSLTLIETLRKASIDVAEALGRESLKTQLRIADKLRSPYALIFGQREAFEECVIIRDLKTGTQETVTLQKLAGVLKKRLSRRA